MYHDYLGREIEDQEMDNMRRDAAERGQKEHVVERYVVSRDDRNTWGVWDTVTNRWFDPEYRWIGRNKATIAAHALNLFVDSHELAAYVR